MRKQSKENKTMSNLNKGFSLVEIIVAIAILAIIVLPLLNSFVTSAKLNEGSKKKLRATEISKNIMEGLKGYNIAEIAEGVNPRALSGFNLGNESTEELTYDVATGKFNIATAKSSIWNAVTGNYDFHPNPANKYYYFLKGVNSGGFKANALITVSKSSISTGKISKITPINTNEDILIDATVRAGIVAEAIKNDSTIPDTILEKKIRENIIESDLKREIHITIGDSGITTVSTEFKYFVKDGRTPISPINGIKTEQSDSPREELRSVYLFFDTWTGALGNEKIVIDNPSSKKFNLYLVKQAVGSTGVARTVVEVKDGTTAVVGESPVKILTNIPASEVTYRYSQGGLLMSEEGITKEYSLVESKNLSEINSFERVYDIEVKLFEADVEIDRLDIATPLVTLTGGISN